MNGFQEELHALTQEFQRACERVCSSEEVSQLDVDVLRRKMRKMYDFLLSAPYEAQKRIAHQSHEDENIVIQRIETPVAEEEPAIQNTVANQDVSETKKEENEFRKEKIEIKKENDETKKEETQPVIEQKEEEPEQEEIRNEEHQKQESASVLTYLHENIMKEHSDRSKSGGSTLDLFIDKPVSIAERFENKNRSDLRTAIGVSEKFLFINDLFSGNLKDYTDFISQLNQASTLEMSMTVIEEMRHKRKWANNSLAYTTLRTLIETRFKK